MGHAFFHWVVAALAIGIAAYLVPGVQVTPLGAFALAVFLGLINLFVRPFITILTLPLTILTLGLFSLVINAFIVLAASAVVPGFTVSGFVTAFLFALLLALVNTLFGVRFMRV